MSKRFKGFSEDEHVKAGKTLKEINKLFRSLTGEVARCYGYSSREYKAVTKNNFAGEYVLEIKDSLDDAYYRECREKNIKPKGFLYFGVGLDGWEEQHGYNPPVS